MGISNVQLVTGGIGDLPRRLIMASIYEWCKKDPKRFEALRLWMCNYCYTGDVKEPYSLNRPTHSWPFPKYVWNGLIVDGYRSHAKGFTSQGVRWYEDPELFDAVLYEQNYFGKSIDASSRLAPRWRLDTFNKLRVYLATDFDIKNFYHNYSTYLDLTEIGNKDVKSVMRELLDDEHHASKGNAVNVYRYYRKLYTLYTGKVFKETEDDIHKVYRWMHAVMYYTLPALRRIQDWDAAYDLLRGMAEPLVKFNSLNEAQTAHDVWMVEDRERRLKDNESLAYPYLYTPQLREVVERSGWRLPVTPMELIERGQEHHNCIGSYESSFRRKKEMLLVLKDDAEAELRLEFEDEFCVGGELIQCKGKFNKNMPNDGLQFLFDSLKGMKKELFKKG
jgi:hypothetical protein